MGWRWNTFIVVLLIAVAITSVVGVVQADDDITAREKLEKNVKRDADIEAARIERIKQINQINAAQCAALQNLYETILRTIEESDSTLDTIEYYRDHPKELQAAHERNQRTIESFRIPPCPPNFALDSTPTP